ncbi:DabB protein [Alteromonas sp. KUL42]|uniref:Dabb family protein n=1 Tax=Alteromonas sp. KUL42 TaxID=2480797 RepID=UPI001035AB8C|nr:Dabb family protein [Alteromonas sp. KUL42]TAP35178.1 Dabb family protein [Alteromonas sp. KUL42]GEA07470.1 DabB protein [Alteromonas sp. KUL42]
MNTSTITRRQFLASAGAAVALTALPTQAETQASLPSVIHTVFFWLKDPTSQSDKEQLIAGLKELAAIPQVKSLHVGVPASTQERDVIDSSYHVSEMMMFESVEAQNQYQVHPLHVKFVENYAHLWERVVVYDSVTAG